MSPFYSSVPNLAMRLERIGADGLVLFNRFYQADIDPETRGTTVRVQLSDSADLLLRLHAIAILSNRVRMSLALSGGVHEPIDVVKAVMAGADAVQLTSTLLRHGPSRLTHLRDAVRELGEDASLRLARSASKEPRPLRVGAIGQASNAQTISRCCSPGVPTTYGWPTDSCCRRERPARLDSRTCSARARSA